jgi:hypothetical protein
MIATLLQGVAWVQMYSLSPKFLNRPKTYDVITGNLPYQGRKMYPCDPPPYIFGGVRISFSALFIRNPCNAGSYDAFIEKIHHKPV